jgi:hypothetical protein
MPEPKPAREVEFEVLGADAPDPEKANVDPFIAFVARLMDDIFVIPGTNIRFGLDPVISLLPTFGATASAFVSVVLIALSARRGLPKIVLVRMVVNVLVNAALDYVPVAGDVLSVFFRSNARNYELLQKHAGQARVSTLGDWLFLVGLFASLFLIVGLMVVGTITVLHYLWVAITR